MENSLPGWGLTDAATSGTSPPPATARRASLRASFLKIAVVASLLSFVLCAIVAHGLYFAVIHNVQQLTIEAARATVFGRTPADRQQIANATIDTAIQAYPLLRRERIDVLVTGAAGDPSVYHVTLVYDASHISIWSLADFMPLPSSRIQHSSTIRRGGI